MIHTSYITYSNSNKLEKLKKKFLYPFKRPSFKINMEEDNPFSKLSWDISNLRVNNATLYNTRKGLRITLRRSSSPFYFVLNCHINNFNKISFSQGICVSDFGALELGLHVSYTNNGNKCSLLVMEYDNCFNRINTIRYENNSINTYTPSANTQRIVICIEVKGSGSSDIIGLTLKKPLSLTQPIGTSRTNENALSMSSGISLTPNQITSESVKAHLDLIHKEKECFSQETFKWKRRAIEWEKKATENGSSQLNNLGYEAIVKLATSLPKSNGSHFHNKFPYKVGIISDTYMYNFYKDVFDELFYLSPTNYSKILKENKLDIILYVTGWKGINNEEWRGIKFREAPSKSFKEIIKHARNNSTKLIFQSIEDPSNFDYFLPIAENFDYIFTSDREMIPKYKEMLKHTNVFYGEYGVNPTFNNPIGSRRDLIDGAFFAGSYTQRYKERCKDMEIVFDSILNSSSTLAIADRNFSMNEPELQFPTKYKNLLIPPISHEVLQNVHKLFRFNINFNSIKNSSTMCAMRIYELQAQGTIIISNYAKSVFNTFPNIRIVPTEENMSFELSKKENLSEYKLRMDSVRGVMTSKTSFDIVDTMLRSSGLNQHKIEKKTIAVLIDGNPARIENYFHKQNYENKILLDTNTIKNELSWKKIIYDEQIDYFTWFNPKHDYQENYLTDLANGFKYTNSHYITKNSFFDGDTFFERSQHEYTTKIYGIDKTLFRADIFSPIDFNKYTLDEEINDIPSGYSIDPFELNYTRHKSILQNQISFVKYELSVIIPVYNNGDFLIHKCIPSLQRNSLWEGFEIILIDDGSSDCKTVGICKTLEKENHNISTYFFPSGGSGSASRPRNKGIELASAELVTFLDPDNEISPGGYDNLIKLYKKANKKEKNVRFVSGYNKKVNAEVTSVAKHTSKPISIVSDFKGTYFKKGRFPTIATQAAVISRIWLKNTPSLRFVEKAAGQDTLFGWELLLEANKGAFTSEAFIIYYADRDGSVTNTVNENYFEKKLILETEQVRMLKKHNLLKTYKKKHLDYFIENWYLIKIQCVTKDEYTYCVHILDKICQLYGRSISSYLNLQA